MTKTVDQFMIKFIYFIWAALVGLPFVALRAQDPVLSQFFVNRLYLNPAMVGLNNGVAFNASYRNQWPGVLGAFNSGTMSVEMQEPCLGGGLGFSAFYDRAGESAFQTAALNLHYAYIIGLGPRRSRQPSGNLHIGMKAGFSQRGINWDKLVFSDQLDPIYGVVRPSAAQTGRGTVAYPDFDAGIAWRQDIRHPIYNKTPFRLLLGLSMQHLLRPNQSLRDVGAILPRRYTVHGGFEIPLAPYRRVGSRKSNEKFFILPNIKYEWQGEPNESYNQALTNVLTWGVYVQTPQSLYFGVLYQDRFISTAGNNTRTLVATAGLDVQGYDVDYVVGVSYDFNIRGLTNRAGGALEVNFRAVLKDRRVFCKGGPGGQPSRKESMRRIQDCNNFF